MIKINHTELPCVFDDRDSGWEKKTSDLCPTQRATRSGIKMIERNLNNGYRIRKLTPKECWRLMGFSDEAFDKAKAAGTSDNQLYKQAGNSIVTDVLYYIFRELYTVMPYLFNDLKVGSYFSGIGAFEVALDRLFEEIQSENQNEPAPISESSVGEKELSTMTITAL